MDQPDFHMILESSMACLLFRSQALGCLEESNEFFFFIKPQLCHVLLIWMNLAKPDLTVFNYFEEKKCLESSFLPSLTHPKTTGLTGNCANHSNSPSCGLALLRGAQEVGGTESESSCLHLGHICGDSVALT